MDAKVGGTWEFNAVAARLKLTRASASVRAHRNDVHSLIVALTRDPTKDVDAVARRQIDLQKASRTKLIKGIRDPRDQLALARVDEDKSTRVVLEMQRRRKLKLNETHPATVVGQKFLDLLQSP